MSVAYESKRRAAIMDEMRNLSRDDPRYLQDYTILEEQMRIIDDEEMTSIRAERNKELERLDTEYKKAVAVMSIAHNRNKSDNQYVLAVKRAITYYIKNDIEMNETTKRLPTLAAETAKTSLVILRQKEHAVIMAGLAKENYTAYCDFMEMAFMAHISQNAIQIRVDKAPKKAADGSSDIDFADSITNYWKNEAKVLRTCYLALKGEVDY
jgi:hypothetical protein